MTLARTAQILAADLLASQAGDVAEQLHALSGEMMIVDTPGQVELFAFREASNHLIEVLGREQSAIIYLFDPMLSRSPSWFVSQMLLYVNCRVSPWTSNEKFPFQE